MNTTPDHPNAGHGGFCRRTRREFLWEAGGGFTGLALTGLLSLDKFFAGTYAGPYEAKLIEAFDASLPALPPWKR